MRLEFVTDKVTIYFDGSRAVRLIAEEEFPDEAQVRDLVRQRFGITVTTGPWKKEGTQWVAVIVTCIPSKHRRP